MKRFLPLLIVAILLVSVIAMTSAFAGVSISGNSEVLAGKSYTYTIKVSANASSIGGTVKCGGVFSGSSVTFWADSPGGTNASISDTVKITVTVAAGATPGQKGTITVSGEGSTYDGENVGSFGISGSKSATVVEKAPTPTKDPNATPKPLEGWEIVEESVGGAQKGAIVEGEMDKDFEIPESLLKKCVENENKLVIDFGTYKCTIDPAALTDFEGIKKLNLKLDFEKAAGLAEVAGEKDVYQLHFGHSGELPGKLTFTFEATENEPGDTVYLYYYYGEAEIIEGKMKAVVDENGMVTFDIYHCSSYFVTSEVLEGAVSNFDTEAATQIEELTTTLQETQTELDEANAQIQTLTTDKTTLEADLATKEQEVDDLEDEVEKASAEPAEKDQGEYSIVVLIAAVAAGILLAILLTMLFTKAGLFRRTQDEIAARDERKAAKQQAKQEAMEAKQQAKREAEQAKQAALESKQQAKQAALESKQQAKAEAMEAKQQAKAAVEQTEAVAEETVQMDDAVKQAAEEDNSEL